MHIRTTTDPISLRDVPNPELHPCLHEGDSVNGLEIYFENGDKEVVIWDGNEENKIFSFDKKSPIVSAHIDPSQKAYLDILNIYTL